MLDHAVGDEDLPLIIEIQSPRIGRAVGNHFKNVMRWMISPHAAVERNPLRIRRARQTHQTFRPDPVAAVKPAIRSPRQPIEHIVLGILDIPPIQHHPRRPGRFIAAVIGRNEKQIRRRANPYTAETDFQSAYIAQMLRENGPLGKMPIATLIFKNDNPIRSRFSVHLPIRIRQTLRHPQPAPIVDDRGDRLHHIRLPGKKRGDKTRR